MDFFYSIWNSCATVCSKKCDDLTKLVMSHLLCLKNFFFQDDAQLHFEIVVVRMAS